MLGLGAGIFREPFGIYGPVVLLMDVEDEVRNVDLCERRKTKAGGYGEAHKITYIA